MGRSLNNRWDRGRRTRSGRESPALRHQIALVKLDLRRNEVSCRRDRHGRVNDGRWFAKVVFLTGLSCMVECPRREV